MAQTSRTFRIFVSSTFSDLKAERNALQERVFPRLRDLAMAHGCRFQAIDLRWGVSEEAALDQQTMKICLGEIERCQTTSPRPNFIVLLGDRYGWQPLPYEIPANEFEEILPLVSKGDKGLLEQWYRRDDNAVPPVYCLQPRQVKVKKKTSEKEKQAAQEQEANDWQVMENKLRTILVNAINKAGWKPDDPRCIKYQASATEQEIMAGALKVTDANEHVFCFLRKIEGIPEDGSAASFREADSESAKKQVELKDRLRKQLAGNVHDYTADWQKDGPSLKHIDQLCKDVYADLSKLIRAEMSQLEAVDALEKEITAHEEFGRDRAQVFIGRADILESIADYINNWETHPLVVWGASGSGKSALMAKVITTAQQNGADITYRFIGATPESSNGRALLESLCRQISRKYGADEDSIPSEYQELVEEFPKRLALATADNPLLLFLDALDQLSDSDNARDLAWLPMEIPSNVYLVVSTLPGECLKILEGNLPEKSRLEVQPMPLKDGKAILQQWLVQAKRELQKEQEQYILDKFKKCALPLYLKLAFEEAHLWKSYDPIPKLSDDIPGILRDMFQRLSLESSHGKMLVERSLGYLAAAKNGLSEDELLDVLSLDEDVLGDFRRRSPKSPKMDSLPVVIWSRLHFDLQPYLTERAADGTSLLAFYHRQMSEAVNAEYLSGKDKPKRHKTLAKYFGEKPLEIVQEEKKTPNLRKLSEQPYQLVYGKLWSELKRTLTDFDFMEAKCRSLSVYDLEKDYQTSLEGWGGKQKDKEVVSAFEERLRLEGHAISKAPELLFPQLYNHLTWLDAPDGPTHSLCEQAAGVHHGWLRMTQDPRPAQPPWLLSIEGHTDSVFKVLVTPDRKQIISKSDDLRNSTIKVWDLQSGLLQHSIKHRRRIINMVVTPDSRHIVSVCMEDNTIEVWNLQSGRLTRPIEDMDGVGWFLEISPDGKRIIYLSGDGASSLMILKVRDLQNGRLLHTMKGHAGKINDLTITPDGARAVTCSDDKTIKVWDLQNGRLLCTLVGHTDKVRAVAVTPDGKQIISGSDDKSIKIWDLQSGHLHRSLNQAKAVKELTVTPDSNIVSCCIAETTINIWDRQSGALVCSLEEGKGEGVRFMISSDGKQVASCLASYNFLMGVSTTAIKVWDLPSGCLLHSLEGHNEQVLTMAFTPDGTQLVSGSKDTSIKVWDLQSGNLLYSIMGPSSINGLAVTPDAKHAVSTGVYNNICTVKVWDLQNGRELRTQQDDGFVSALVVTPDGKQVVTGSYNKPVVKVWDLQSGDVLCLMEGHKEGVNAIAVTPDGKQVISCSGVEQFAYESMDNSIKVWDIQSGRLLCTLEGHTRAVSDITITPDGKQIVSCSADETIKIWDIKNGRLLRSISAYIGHDDSNTVRTNIHLTTVAVTPDGKQIVCGSGQAEYENKITIWDLQSGQLVHAIISQAYEVRSLSITPDGKYILSGSKNDIKIWDLQNGQLLCSLKGHENKVMAITVTSDGKKIISGSQDNTIKVWDLQSAFLPRSLERRPGSLVVTQDWSQAISSSDRDLKVWDFASGRLLRSLEGESDEVDPLAVTPDGKQVISYSADRTFMIWNLQDAYTLYALEGQYQMDDAYEVRFAITPDGKKGVAFLNAKSLNVWDLQSGRLLYTLPTAVMSIGHDAKMVLTSDGKKVVTWHPGFATGGIKCWDILNGNQISSIRLEGDDEHARLSSVALTPDGDMIISGWQDAAIRICDLHSGRLLRTLTGHAQDVSIIAVTPDGKQAISGSKDTTIKIWDLQSGRLVRSLEGHAGAVNTLAISPDGTQFFSGSDDKTLRLWDILSGKSQALFYNESSLTSITTNGHWLMFKDSDFNSWIFEWIQ